MIHRGTGLFRGEGLFRGQIEVHLEYRNKSRGALMFLRASVSIRFLESVLKAAVTSSLYKTKTTSL